MKIRYVIENIDNYFREANNFATMTPEEFSENIKGYLTIDNIKSEIINGETVYYGSFIPQPDENWFLKELLHQGFKTQRSSDGRFRKFFNDNACIDVYKAESLDVIIAISKNGITYDQIRDLKYPNKPILKQIDTTDKYEKFKSFSVNSGWWRYIGDSIRLFISGPTGQGKTDIRGEVYFPKSVCNYKEDDYHNLHIEIPVYWLNKKDIIPGSGYTIFEG